MLLSTVHAYLKFCCEFHSSPVKITFHHLIKQNCWSQRGLELHWMKTRLNSTSFNILLHSIRKRNGHILSHPVRNSLADLKSFYGNFAFPLKKYLEQKSLSDTGGGRISKFSTGYIFIYFSILIPSFHRISIKKQIEPFEQTCNMHSVFVYFFG